MKKKTNMMYYEKRANALRFNVDYENNVIFGTRSGFNVMLYPEDMRYENNLTIGIYAKSPENRIFDKKENDKFTKEFKDFMNLHESSDIAKKLISLQQCNNFVKINMKVIIKDEQENKVTDSIIDFAIDFLKSKGYQQGCQVCGQQIEALPYIIKSEHMYLCTECFNRVSHGAVDSIERDKRKPENFIGGIVGALLGSLLGILSIIIFGQMGEIAVASGVIMATCTIKGYEIFGGKLTGKGLFISCIMMIIMTYIGDRLDWVLSIMREFGSEVDIDFITVYQFFPEMLSENLIDMNSYLRNLFLLYLFTLVGVIPTIHGIIKERRENAKIVAVRATGYNV